MANLHVMSNKRLSKHKWGEIQTDKYMNEKATEYTLML